MARRRSLFGNLSKLLKPPSKGKAKSLFPGPWTIDLKTGRKRKSKGFD
jgi:hypothetical protein